MDTVFLYIAIIFSRTLFVDFSNLFFFGKNIHKLIEAALALLQSLLKSLCLSRAFQEGSPSLFLENLTTYGFRFRVSLFAVNQP